MEAPNPFTYGNPITDPNRFIGRRREVEQVFSRLKNPEFESSSIVGERRLGKTSLLNFVSHPDVIASYGLDPRTHLFIYVDLEMVGPESTPTRFYQHLLRRMASRVEDPELKGELARLGKQDTMDSYDLADAFDAIDRKGLHVVLLMDEFENISQNVNFKPEFYFGLRALAIHHNLALVTASKQDLVELSQEAEVRSSPFFNIFATINVQPFTRPEMEDLLRRYLDGTGISFSQDELGRVVQLAGLHPHLLQTAFWYLFEGHRRQLAGKELEDFVDFGFVPQAQPHFQAYWEHSDDEQKVLLALLAFLDAAGGGPGQPRAAQELQKWYRRAPNVLSLLARRGLLTRMDDAYVLFSSAFARWLVGEITAPLSTLPGPEEFDKEAGPLLASLPKETAQQASDWIRRSRTRYWRLFLRWLADPSTVAAVLQALAAGGAPLAEVGSPAASVAEAPAASAVAEKGPDQPPPAQAPEKAEKRDVIEFSEAERRVVKILAAHDPVVGVLFTRTEGTTDSMKVRLGDYRAEQLLKTHNNIVRQQMATHGGFEVKNVGDGFMLAFNNTRHALQCAVDVQRAFAAHNEHAPKEPLHVRIGVDAMEPLKEGEEFFGGRVLVPWRIAEQAKGGEILASSLVKERSESGWGIQFEEGREVELRGLPGKHQVYRVGWQEKEDAAPAQPPEKQVEGKAPEAQRPGGDAGSPPRPS